MNYAELATELLRLGCYEAVNLDGGGSSVMAVRDPVKNESRDSQRADGWPRAGGGECAGDFADPRRLSEFSPAEGYRSPSPYWAVTSIWP